MKSITFTTSALCIFLSLIDVAGQSPSKILKQAERALGGTRQLQSLQSWQKTGRITRLRDGSSGRYFLQAQRPNLFNLNIELNGFEIETGYNGRSAWTRNSRDGLQTLTGSASLNLQAKAAFRNSLWLNYKNEKSKTVSSGQTNVNGKPANVIVLTTSKGIVIKLFFDAATGLLLRDEIPDGDLIESCDYDDYRDVGGVKMAFAYRVKLGDDVYEVKLEEIKRDQPIAKTEFDFPSVPGDPLPDLTKLLADVQANEDKVEALLDTYSFTQKNISRELGKDGTLRETGSEAYQLSFYKGYRIQRLIEKNGKPLNEKEQADEDKEAGKRVAEIEKEIARKEKQAPGSPPSPESQRVSIAEVLRASKLTNPRRERFRRRDVIVFDFEPNPLFDFKNAKSMLKFFGKTAGVIWIDEKDKQVARVEAYLYDDFKVGGGVLAKLKKGASFTLEQERVNDEIWLPSRADINLSVRVLLIKGINVNQIIKSYDYHKFTTEVKDAKVGEDGKP